MFTLDAKLKCAYLYEWMKGLFEPSLCKLLLIKNIQIIFRYLNINEKKATALSAFACDFAYIR